MFMAALWGMTTLPPGSDGSLKLQGQVRPVLNLTLRDVSIKGMCGWAYRTEKSQEWCGPQVGLDPGTPVIYFQLTAFLCSFPFDAGRCHLPAQQP